MASRTAYCTSDRRQRITWPERPPTYNTGGMQTVHAATSCTKQHNLVRILTAICSKLWQHQHAACPSIVVYLRGAVSTLHCSRAQTACQRDRRIQSITQSHHRTPNSAVRAQACSGHPGSQRKRYRDQLRVNLKTCNIDYTKLEALAADRSQWRRLCYSAVEQFEQQRIDTAKTRRATRKAHTFTTSSTSTSYICDTCGYVCSSRIRLFDHNRRHR